MRTDTMSIDDILTALRGLVSRSMPLFPATAVVHEEEFFVYVTRLKTLWGESMRKTAGFPHDGMAPGNTVQRIDDLEWIAETGKGFFGVKLVDRADYLRRLDAVATALSSDAEAARQWRANPPPENDKVADARAQADQILADARREAERIIAEAREGHR